MHGVAWWARRGDGVRRGRPPRVLVGRAGAGRGVGGGQGSAERPAACRGAAGRAPGDGRPRWRSTVGVGVVGPVGDGGPRGRGWGSRSAATDGAARWPPHPGRPVADQEEADGRDAYGPAQPVLLERPWWCGTLRPAATPRPVSAPPRGCRRGPRCRTGGNRVAARPPGWGGRPQPGVRAPHPRRLREKRRGPWWLG